MSYNEDDPFERAEAAERRAAEAETAMQRMREAAGDRVGDLSQAANERERLDALNAVPMYLTTAEGHGQHRILSCRRACHLRGYRIIGVSLAQARDGAPGPEDPRVSKKSAGARAPLR